MLPSILLLLLCYPSLLYSYYCPYQHRHVGRRNILRLRGEEEGGGRYDEQMVGRRKEEGGEQNVEQIVGKGNEDEEQSTPASLPLPSYWTDEEHERYGHAVI